MVLLKPANTLQFVPSWRQVTVIAGGNLVADLHKQVEGRRRSSGENSVPPHLTPESGDRM